MNRTLDIALAALSKHPCLHLFPVEFGNKAQPLLKDYLNRASNNPAQIRRWHAYWKTRFNGVECWWGVAPALSGLVFADIDTKPGKRGQQTFDEFDLLYGWPQTMVTGSPSGGRHHWHRGRHLFALGTDKSNHPGIDFAQYVILPGCMKADGTGYTLQADHPIADAPDWFYVEAKRWAAKVEAMEQEPVIDLDQAANIDWAKDYLQHYAPRSVAYEGGEKTTLDVATVLKDYGISELMALELMAEFYNVEDKSLQMDERISEAELDDLLGPDPTYIEPPTERRHPFKEYTYEELTNAPKEPGRKAPMTNSKDFIEDEESGGEDTFVERDDTDFCAEDDAADDKAFQKRLSHRLQIKKFVAWLEREGYDQNEVTPQMVDEFDELQMKESRERRAKSAPPPPPPPIVELVDAAKTEEDEWNAGVDQWMREGHDPGTVPIERPKWEALLGRRAARLKAQQAKAQLENRRQLVINSLKPPKQSDIALNGKSICDAQNAYQKGREELSEAWNSKYQELPGDVAEAWDVYHRTEGNPEICLRARTPTANDFPADPTKIKNGLADPEYQKFQRYSAAILQQLEQLEANLEHALNPPAGSRPPLKGWSLDEIDENDGSVWPVPRLIPHGLTFVYGLPKGGKSLWMQKLSACIAGGVPFDGIEELEHGRVLYITRDIGASRQEVKKRLMKILPHLGLSEDALDGKLILTDDPFYLNDPASVDTLLAHNPGRFVLVVIDSLFRCVSGSLSQDVVASAAVDAIDRISRATGAAMVAIHHEPRSGEHLFGSVMLDAAYDAQIHVERGKERNSVIVTVQELKNAAVPDKPFTYRIEEEYLAAVAGAGAASATTLKLASSRHQEMLALLPAGWFTRKEGRKLVEPLLTGAEEARRKQWQRAVAAMKASGEIEVRTTRMRKT